MVISKSSAAKIETLIYSDSDGKPMADNTKQFNWIVKIKENLEICFAQNQNIFVAGDLLWYPIEGSLEKIAPDVMVIFGRPKGDRGSYRQWQEENMTPQVVFEILSPSNDKREMLEKLNSYDTYGVEEYYLYDPNRIKLDGWLRQNNALVPILSMQNWVSPRLGIRFELFSDDLEIYRPDGTRFQSPLELEAAINREKLRADKLANYLRSLGIDPDRI
jgi:Uma2 family endonuclease